MLGLKICVMLLIMKVSWRPEQLSVGEEPHGSDESDSDQVMEVANQPQVLLLEVPHGQDELELPPV